MPAFWIAADSATVDEAYIRACVNEVSAASPYAVSYPATTDHDGSDANFRNTHTGTPTVQRHVRASSDRRHATPALCHGT